MIKKIRWNNHDSLGNLELDFTKDDGSAYGTIVFAGENGSGKTTILETLKTFLSGQSMLPFSYIEYQVAGRDFRIAPADDERTVGLYGFHERTDIQTGEITHINSGRGNSTERYQNDSYDLRSYGYAYSKARSGFNTKPIKATTITQLDEEKYESDEYDDFTRIKQLLVDIDEQDSSEWMMQSRAGNLSDSAFECFNAKSKIHRFRSAFDGFFSEVAFVGVDHNDPNEKRIVFSKHNRRVSIDSLSTGEKQIVFRGAQLLWNINNKTGGLVLIDEPELSLHPSWQKKILSYYRNLFTNNGVQDVQMLIATHSEYVVRSAIEHNGDVLVITLSDDNGVIRASRVTAPNALPTITAAETNYLAFGIISIDYHIQLYGYLQVKTNNHSVKQCDSYIRNSPFYRANIHEKLDYYNNTIYSTLPTYIRNAIDHPDSGRQYSEQDLRISVELLIDLCT